MDGGGEGNRSGRAMRRDAHVLDRGERRDLLGDRQAAAMGDVHLDDVAGTQGGQPGEVRQCVETLAGRNRECGSRLHLLQEFDRFRGDRFLAPDDVVAGGCQAPVEADRFADPEPAVDLDHQADRRTDRAGDGVDDRHRGVLLVAAQGFPGGGEGVELDRLVAAGGDRCGAGGKIRRRQAAAVPAIGIGVNRLANAAADQAPDRLVAGLADQVPHRDLDPADRGHHGRAALVLVADHAADDRLDVEGIATDDARGDPFVEEHLDGALLPLERGLADAGQAGVGGQADEQVVADAGIGEEGLEAGDLHGAASFSWPSFCRASSMIMTASRSLGDCGGRDQEGRYRAHRREEDGRRSIRPRSRTLTATASR